MEVQDHKHLAAHRLGAVTSAYNSEAAGGFIPQHVIGIQQVGNSHLGVTLTNANCMLQNRVLEELATRKCIL